MIHLRTMYTGAGMLRRKLQDQILNYLTIKWKKKNIYICTYCTGRCWSDKLGLAWSLLWWQVHCPPQISPLRFSELQERLMTGHSGFSYRSKKAVDWKISLNDDKTLIDLYIPIRGASRKNLSPFLRVGHTVHRLLRVLTLCYCRNLTDIKNALYTQITDNIQMSYLNHVGMSK